MELQCTVQNKPKVGGFWRFMIQHTHQYSGRAGVIKNRRRISDVTTHHVDIVSGDCHVKRLYSDVPQDNLRFSFIVITAFVCLDKIFPFVELLDLCGFRSETLLL